MVSTHVDHQFVPGVVFWTNLGPVELHILARCGGRWSFTFISAPRISGEIADFTDFSVIVIATAVVVIAAAVVIVDIGSSTRSRILIKGVMRFWNVHLGDFHPFCSLLKQNNSTFSRIYKHRVTSKLNTIFCNLQATYLQILIERFVGFQKDWSWSRTCPRFWPGCLWIPWYDSVFIKILPMVMNLQLRHNFGCFHTEGIYWNI